MHMQLNGRLYVGSYVARHFSQVLKNISEGRRGQLWPSQGGYDPSNYPSTVLISLGFIIIDDSRQQEFYQFYQF